MKYKIRIDYLNITNIPVVEKILADMARKGWLIKKIISGSLFIYEKIEPRELDFSITPYEIETSLDRKSKKDLAEYRDLCREVGWNYITSSFDLHIYFKDVGQEAMDIHTDELVEFDELEKLINKQLKSLYIFLPILFLMTYGRLRGMFNNSYYMRNGLIQGPALFILPMVTITGVLEFFNLKKFLKINRKNLDLNKAIEYSKSKNTFIKLFFTIFYISIVLLMVYIFYSFVFLKNSILGISLIIPIVGLLIGTAYRYIVKPRNFSKPIKVGLLILTMFFSGLAGSFLSFLGTKDYSVNGSRLKDLKIVKLEDFGIETKGMKKVLLKDSSLLIPFSYNYSEYSSDKRFDIEYSKALNEDLAKKLVRVYIKENKDIRFGRLYDDLEYLYGKENPRDEELFDVGLSRDEYFKFKSEDIKISMDKAFNYIYKQNTGELDPKSWQVDEVYSLNKENTRLVLRKDREVYLLEGVDFSKDENRDIVIKKLSL